MELTSLGISEITELVVKVNAQIVQRQNQEAPKILRQVVEIMI
jgi:sulfur carrier protein ThiS